MWARIRVIWVIWLLALAVPAQGLAAATMAFCGSNHQRTVVASQAHASAGVDCLHEHAATARSADEVGGDISADATKANTASAHKCSACTACHAVGALLTTVVALPAPAPTTTVFHASVPRVAPFAADGPERPPRDVLA